MIKFELHGEKGFSRPVQRKILIIMALKGTTIVQPTINASKSQKLRRRVRCYLNGDLTTVTANSGCTGYVACKWFCESASL